MDSRKPYLTFYNVMIYVLLDKMSISLLWFLISMISLTDGICEDQLICKEHHKVVTVSLCATFALASLSGMVIRILGIYKLYGPSDIHDWTQLLYGFGQVCLFYSAMERIRVNNFSCCAAVVSLGSIDMFAWCGITVMVLIILADVALLKRMSDKIGQDKK
jgi:hypothetical protein